MLYWAAVFAVNSRSSFIGPAAVVMYKTLRTPEYVPPLTSIVLET